MKHYAKTIPTFIDCILHIRRMALVRHAHPKAKNGVLQEFKQLQIGFDVLIVEQLVDLFIARVGHRFAFLAFEFVGQRYDRFDQAVLTTDGLLVDLLLGKLTANCEALVKLAQTYEFSGLIAAVEYAAR